MAGRRRQQRDHGGLGADDHKQSCEHAIQVIKAQAAAASVRDQSDDEVAS
jgi:hypothetical protein